MKPIRYQLSRRKGWTMPPNTVNVARPGKWGNIFSVAPLQAAGSKVAAGRYVAVPTVEDAVACFRYWLADNPAGRELAEAAKRELRGKNLACWCKVGDLCHADVLLDIANKTEK